MLTQTYASPATSQLIEEFKEDFGNVSHVTYDAISHDAALTAYESRYSERALAQYDFKEADVIVSFGADFLGDWQGGGYDSGYAKGRVPAKGKMSKHIQFESLMTLTGANADKRVPLKPSEQKRALAYLYGKLNNSNVNTDLSEALVKALDQTAKEIKNAGSKAVVVTGIDDVNAQALVLSINEMLSSNAFMPQLARYTRLGSDTAMKNLLADMKAGRVGALLIDGVNPSYTLPNAEEFNEALGQVELSVLFSTNWNETAENVGHTAAASNHYLESWGDAEFVRGHYSLMQPTIKELFDTRQFQQCLLNWMGSSTPYYQYIKDTWTASYSKWIFME